MLIDRLANIFIFLFTVCAYIQCFTVNGRWDTQSGLRALRFFTVLSNLFCAVASFLVALTLPKLPYGIWIAKYIATCALAVTCITVLVFLGPAFGYKNLLSGRDFYLHLAGPVLAVLTFCFLERQHTLSFAASLRGMLPVLLYAVLYFYKVVIKKEWEDFYGYNKNGTWPVSMVAMFSGAFLVCVLIRFLCNL